MDTQLVNRAAKKALYSLSPTNVIYDQWPQWHMLLSLEYQTVAYVILWDGTASANYTHQMLLILNLWTQCLPNITPMS